MENIPIKIYQLYIPTDFVVMDMEENTHIPILFGRPLLATIEAIIDIKKRKLSFEVGDKKIKFIFSNFMKNKSIGYSCPEVDINDERVREYSSGPLLINGLKVCLIGSSNLKNDKAKAYEITLDKNICIQNQCFKLLTTYSTKIEIKENRK